MEYEVAVTPLAGVSERVRDVLLTDTENRPTKQENAHTITFHMRSAIIVSYHQLQ